MPTTYEVQVSAQAFRDVERHALFLARVNRKAADELLSSFEEALENLETFPNRFPMVQYGPMKRRSCHVSPFGGGRYLIIYTIKKNLTVFINTVIDCRGENKDWLTNSMPGLLG